MLLFLDGFWVGVWDKVVLCKVFMFNCVVWIFSGWCFFKGSFCFFRLLLNLIFDLFFGVLRLFVK